MNACCDLVVDSPSLNTLWAWQMQTPPGTHESSSGMLLPGLGVAELLVIPLLATLAIVPIVLIAAARMREFQSRGLAIAGSVLIMMPVSLIALAGIPVGIWSLSVLLRNDVRKAFLSRSVSVDTTRAQLKTGSWWLMAGGCLSIFVVIAIAITTISAGQLAGMSYPRHLLSMFLIFVVGLPLSLSLLQIISLVYAHYAGSYRSFCLACVLGLIPYSPAWFVSLPAAIFSIAVLNQSTAGVKHNSQLFEKRHSEAEGRKT